MYVFDALEVYAFDALGKPTSYVNTAIGLPAGGIMRLVTGRPGLNGSKIIAGDSAATTWYEDILAENDGDFLPSRAADFVDGGCLESVSTMSFSFLNTEGIVHLLEANGVFLNRCKIIYYRIFSADLITFTFEQRFFGTIDDQPFNELSSQVQCVSSAKANLKTNPKIPVNPVTFPGAPQKSQDQYIPLVVGRVAHAPLINVKEAGERAVLTSIGGVEYKVAACNGAFGNSPQMKTNGVKFLKGDPRIVNKFLSVIQGGTAQSIRILDVLQTDVSDPFNYYTFFILAENLTGVITPWTVGPREVLDPEVTYFEVVDLAPILVVADGPISEIKTNSTGRPAISTYDTDTGKFEDVSEMQLTNSPSNVNSTGFPGVSVVSKSANQSGDLINYFSITPDDIQRVSVTHLDNDLPAGSCPLLFDKREDAGHYYTFTQAAGDFSGTITVDVFFPNDRSLKQFDELYLLPDLVAFHSFNEVITATIVAFDIYGGQKKIVNNGGIFSGTGSGAVGGDAFNLLPRSYFNEAGNIISDAQFYSLKANLNISPVISNTKATAVFLKLRVTFNIFWTFPHTFTLYLKEIGIIGKRAVSVSSESLFMPTIGAAYGSTWDGRRGPTEAITNPVDFIEYLIRVRDTDGDPWAQGVDRLEGDRCRSTADNGQIFICTTPGTSGLTEPTWTDTAGATYTDGTAEWQQFQEIPIDKDAMDLATTQRRFWSVGADLLDPKPTEDIIREICEESYLIGMTDRYGKFKVKAWRENLDPVAAFSKANIYAGSMEGGLTPSAMRRVCTTLKYGYDWNPASKKYNKQIQISNVDKPAFPGPAEVVEIGTSLGTFSATYTIAEGGLYILKFTTAAAHQMVTGDYAMLSGNADGYNFPSTAIYQVHDPITGIPDDFKFQVIVFDVVPTASPSTSGVLSKLTNRRLKWKDYVIGFNSWAYAADAWNACHAGWMISKTTNQLSDEFGNLFYFIDPAAVDDNGDYYWPDLGDLGDEHAAVYKAQNDAAWVTRQKKQGPLEVVDDGTFSHVEIGDPISIQEEKLTADAVLIGWVSEVTQIAKTDKDPHRIRFGLTLNPEDLPSIFDTIDEEGATDEIDEEGATDVVDEEF